MAIQGNGNGNGNGRAWWRKRENILASIGTFLILGTFINAEIFSRAFHYEFLLAGLACWGVTLTQLGDKRL